MPFWRKLESACTEERGTGSSPFIWEPVKEEPWAGPRRAKRRRMEKEQNEREEGSEVEGEEERGENNGYARGPADK